MLGPFHLAGGAGHFYSSQVAPWWTFAGRSMFEVTLLPSRNTGPHRARENHRTAEPDQTSDQGDQDAPRCAGPGHQRLPGMQPIGCNLGRSERLTRRDQGDQDLPGRFPVWWAESSHRCTVHLIRMAAAKARHDVETNPVTDERKRFGLHGSAD